MIDLSINFFREKVFLGQHQWYQLAPRNWVCLTGVCKQSTNNKKL